MCRGRVKEFRVRGLGFMILECEAVRIWCSGRGLGIGVWGVGLRVCSLGFEDGNRRARRRVNTKGRGVLGSG
jgi:hypothetical protein